MYPPKVGAPKYVKGIIVDIKGRIESNTVIAGNFNSPLLPMD